MLARVRFVLAVLAVCVASCGRATSAGPRDAPACLYELVTNDGGPASFVVQGFGTLAECHEYERNCNSATWPNATALRCTECCDVCGL